MRNNLIMTAVISAAASAITGLVVSRKRACSYNKIVDLYEQLCDKYSNLIDEYTGTLEEYIQFMCDIYGIDPDDMKKEEDKV